MRIFQIMKRIILIHREHLQLCRLQVIWRERNTHNKTNIGRRFPIEKVTVGKGTYGTLNVMSYGNPDEKLTIGSFCSIATNTYFILSGEHRYDTISTYPFGKLVFCNEYEAGCRGSIEVGDDVWFGYGCIVLSGVKIGQGAVIAAGSVVSKDIPPYGIFVNGRVLKYRFSENIIEKLMQLHWNSVLLSDNPEEMSILKTLISEDNVDEVIHKLSDRYERNK